MAVQTIYLLGTAAVTPNWWGNIQLNGSAPTAANSAYGWAPAKTSLSTAFYRGRLGATGTSGTAAQAASYNASTSGPTPGTGSGTTTAGDSFIAGPFNGTFAATAWAFNFNLRAGTAGCVGHVNMRIWKSANANGSSPTQLLANTAGAIVTLSTSADTNSSISWSPGALTLNNEYLFFQVEWQETTVGSSNSDTVLFRIGTASVTTPDFLPLVTGTLSVSQGVNTLSAAANVATVKIALLLHFDGTDTSTSFPDDSGNSHVVTPHGAAQINTAQFKFGGASGKFSNPADNIALDGSSDFSFSTSDFTIDQWVRFDTLANYTVADWAPGPQIRIKSDGHVVYNIGGADQITSAAALSVNTQYHLAVTRAAGTTRLFINGVAEATTYVASDVVTALANRPLIGGGVIYVGPGDVVSGAKAFWGHRAYSSAAIGTNAFTLRRDSDNTTKTFVTIPGGGINTADSFFNGSNYFVTKYFDQTGNGNDVTQATAANQPPFSLTTGPGGKPGVNNSSATDSWCNNSIAIGQTQPWTISSVWSCSVTFGNQQIIWTDSGVQVGANAGVSYAMYMFDTGAVLQTAGFDGLVHSVHYNSVSGAGASAIYVDGTSAITGTQAAGIGSGGSSLMATSTGGVRVLGVFGELGIWPGFTSTQITNMTSNQRAWWGF